MNIKNENSSAYWIIRPGRGDRINILGSGSIVLNNIKDGIINFEGLASQPISLFGKNDISNKPIEILPSEFSLSQNYPNPFNPTTIVNYQLPIDNYVTLKVYDVLGREVATLVDEFKPAGNYDVTWHATNVPSGVYIYKLQAGNFTSVKKMVLMK